MRKVLLLISLCVGIGLVHGKDKEVQVKGMGATYRSAVVEALITALEQQTGVVLNAATRMSFLEEEGNIKVRSREEQRKIINDRLTRQLTQYANGRISGYKVISERYDPRTKRYSVTLSVRIPGEYALGQVASNRRRLAVGNFYTKTKQFSCRGAQYDSLNWVERFVDDLTTRLTQTRKFAMLERKFSSDVELELKQLAHVHAAPGDVVRMKQRLATDYLVVGTVNFFDNPVSVNPITGQASATGSLFAEVFYRVILVATGQVKWSDTVKLDSSMFYGASGAFLVASCDYAAAAVSDSIMGNIYPYEVVKVLQDGTLVIGEGGKGLTTGEVYGIYVRGEAVEDPHTKEILDYVETRLGTVQILQVLPKLSYARLLEGDGSKVKIGCRLHREAQPAPLPQPPPANYPLPDTSVKGTSQGGVITPF